MAWSPFSWRQKQYLESMYRKQPFAMFLEGTLGYDTGPGSDGVLMGILTAQAIDKAFAADAAVYTDETTAANEATANDMTFWPATPAANDAYYLGMDNPWFGFKLTVGTAAANLVMTSVWEYYNGTAWATLTPILDETAILQPAGTGTKYMFFEPPASWAAVAVNSVSKYWVRARCSAYTSKTTIPLGTRIYTYELAAASGVGIQAPYEGKITKVQWNASTVSGATADSKFAICNLTKQKLDVFTVTKAVAAGADATLNLEFDQNDELVIKQLTEDGATEFADMQLWLHMKAAN